MTRPTFPPLSVCPDTHHEPHPSAPVHCPSWCESRHLELLWLACCELVIHTRQLATTGDQAVTVWLEAVESPTGTDPARLGIGTGPRDLADLTLAQVDDYAATLHRAATRARAILGDLQ